MKEMPGKVKNNFTIHNAEWSAVADIGFTEENVVRMAEAFSRYLHSQQLKNPKVAIGFDNRKNSNHFAELFAQILSSNHIHSLLSTRIIPAPVLSYAVKCHQCNAGIMITGGNKPSKYNGIKFKAPSGGPFSSRDMQNISELVTEKHSWEQNNIHLEKIDFFNDYIGHLKSLVDFELLKAFGKVPSNNASVMIDSMGGTGQTILEDILVSLEWRAQTIFGEPELNFYDRIPESNELNLQPLIYNTEITDALLGIATDGAAEHCGIVIDNGKYMNEFETTLALNWHLRTNKQWEGDILISTSFPHKIEILTHKLNAKVFDNKNEYELFTQEVLKKNFMFGTEEPGGYFFQNHIPDSDGILTGLMFCEMIAYSRKTLNELLKGITSTTN